jgi:hypothetical protein
MENNIDLTKKHKEFTMKTFCLTTILCLFTQLVNAQQFSVPLSLCDSINANQFHYVIDGYGVFTDSMTVHAELRNPLDNTIVFTGEHSISDVFSSTLNGFSYDVSSGAYHFVIGTYATSDLILHMWLMTNDIKEQEVFYQE